MTPKTLSRNPSGVTKAKLISLRLRPEERALADQIAATRGVTRSALARQAFLAGLHSLSSQDVAAIASGALSGGESTSSAAGPFSSVPDALAA